MNGHTAVTKLFVFVPFHAIRSLLCATHWAFKVTIASRPDNSVLHSWVSLVSKNYEIERAIVQLENELSQLRQQQGDENKENIRQDF